MLPKLVNVDETKTQYGVTQTRHGVIAHFQHPSGIDLPVKVRPGRPDTRGVAELPTPIYYQGALVYALPGGGEFMGPVTEGLQ